MVAMWRMLADVGVRAIERRQQAAPAGGVRTRENSYRNARHLHVHARLAEPVERIWQAAATAATTTSWRCA